MTIAQGWHRIEYTEEDERFTSFLFLPHDDSATVEQIEQGLLERGGRSITIEAISPYVP